MKFLFLLILVGCGANIQESFKENGKNIEKSLDKDDTDENAGKKGIGGFIVRAINLIIPSAHAAPICRSSKSQDSNYYAELFEIIPPDLNSEISVFGLLKICDVDIKSNDSYFFDVDPDDFGDALIKIKIVDNRTNSLHNQKELISYPGDEDFTINLERTLQTKMIVDKFNAVDLRYAYSKDSDYLNSEVPQV